MLRDLFDILKKSNFNDAEALKFIDELQTVDSRQWEEFLENKAKKLGLCEICFEELVKETRSGVYVSNPQNTLYEKSYLVCLNCGWSDEDL